MRSLPPSREADPADETLRTGLEYRSRMLLRASNTVEREKMRREGGLYPVWLAEELDLCPRCQRQNDGDGAVCELCVGFTGELVDE